MTNLLDAVRDRNTSQVREILAKEPEAVSTTRGRWGESVLHIAARYGTLEIAEILIDHIFEKFDVADAVAMLDAPANRGGTPLHWATNAYYQQKGNVEVAKLLIEKGANPAARDQNELTPSDWARATGATDIGKLLPGKRENQYCRGCGKHNPEGCCPDCGEIKRSDRNFCEFCGAALSGTQKCLTCES